MEKSASKNGMTAIAYVGDAMTLLAFNLDESIKNGLAGFTIYAKPPTGKGYYLNNRISFREEVLAKNGINDEQRRSTAYSPIQKFRWIHVPNPDQAGADAPWGDYKYAITPRYIKEGQLLPPDAKLTVNLTVPVQPYNKDGVKIGFARGFVASQAYVNKFGMDDRIRYNKNDLVFDVNSNRCYNTATRKDDERAFTYEQQHAWLGWQARRRILELLDDTLTKGCSLDVFAYDFDEPVITNKLLELAGKGRLRMILDNSDDGEPAGRFKLQWSKIFAEGTKGASVLERGKFGALAHSKIFIQRKGKKALQVLTGSTNFSTNGIYINNNHVLVFSNPKVAELYEKVFEAALGKEKMDAFSKSEWAAGDQQIEIKSHPKMVVRFSPHQSAYRDRFFKLIAARIRKAGSDVLFAIMDDDSKSPILDAVRSSVNREDIFTYGITDSTVPLADGSRNTAGIRLYAPGTRKGVLASGKGLRNILPPPFKPEPKIDGHNIHHKFIVVDFKGADPVLYCGSSNLALGPEQKNGDNLLEIHDRDIVTVFAIEAIRLVDHFHFRNRKKNDTKTLGAIMLWDDEMPPPRRPWYAPYYDKNDLRFVERVKLGSATA